MDIKLEVCVDSIVSAIAAAEGGASRIELCTALSEGGLTPTLGTLKILKQLPLNIPIYCMLRPRRGNDFVYSDKEIEALLCDLEVLKAEGADGFVFGALTAEREINVEQCQKIVAKAGSLPVTFHRAFDVTNPAKMHENVQLLIEIGFKRILSSGFRPTATEGSDALAALIAKYHRDIVIMPGAGITVGNLEALLTSTKCMEFHGSARISAEIAVVSEGRMECDTTISVGKQDVEPFATTDIDVVRRMVAIGKAMAEK